MKAVLIIVGALLFVGVICEVWYDAIKLNKQRKDKK